MPTHAPPCQSQNSCMWHRPTCGEAHIQDTSGSLEPFVSGCAHCWQKAILYYLECAHYWQKLSTVEKLSRSWQGTEYQHRRRHTSNILCRIQKNSHCQRCNKICWDITLQRGEQQRHQMARQTLGAFHINLKLPMSHTQQSQFQQGVVQEIIQQFGPTQIVLFEPPGEISLPKRGVLAIKWSIKELQHLTYFTDFIIVHGVQCSQCCNLRGCWIQATYAINTAIPKESCED
jgi:hypothetical protein